MTGRCGSARAWTRGWITCRQVGRKQPEAEAAFTLTEPAVSVAAIFTCCMTFEIIFQLYVWEGESGVQRPKRFLNHVYMTGPVEGVVGWEEAWHLKRAGFRSSCSPSVRSTSVTSPNKHEHKINKHDQTVSRYMMSFVEHLPACLDLLWDTEKNALSFWPTSIGNLFGLSPWNAPKSLESESETRLLPRRGLKLKLSFKN